MARRVRSISQRRRTTSIPGESAAQVVAWAVAEVTYEVGRRGLVALGGLEEVRAFWSRQLSSWSEYHRLSALLNTVHIEHEAENIASKSCTC